MLSLVIAGCLCGASNLELFSAELEVEVPKKIEVEGGKSGAESGGYRV